MDQHNPLTSKEVQEIMGDFASSALAAAKKFGKELDSTFDSIEQVEEIIEICFQAYQKNDLDEEGVEIFAEMFGGYIGEVYRKVKNGKWDYDPSFETIVIKSPRGFTFFPIAKVHKRIIKGEDENLWYFAKFMFSQK
ncbi:MAG: hypothetical protein ACRCYZ_05585 [Alphaproteobacteria bacterium]